MEVFVNEGRDPQNLQVGLDNQNEINLEKNAPVRSDNE